MFSSLRTRFGIPGVISVIALVFAMFGGAYAASNSSGGGKATASAKAKQGPRGKTGKTGPAGPAGPAGPQGAAGAKGDKGDAGSNGTNGTNGADGKSAEAVSFTGSKTVGSVTCTEGGLEVKSAKPASAVCNGVKGVNGQTGFTESLPAGKTETGVWGVENFAASAKPLFEAFSFPIPLPETTILTFNLIDKDGTAIKGSAANCPGTSAEPKANAENLCIYVDPTTVGGVGLVEPFLTTRYGVLASVTAQPSTLLMATWAVTA